MAESVYDNFVADVKAFLLQQGAINESNTRSMKDIVWPLRDKYADRVEDSTLYQYLSRAANQDNDTGIVSLGSRRGYYFSQSAVQVADVLSTDEVQEEVQLERSGRVYREKALYRAVEAWVERQGYAAKNISDKKNGGKWSNPDLVGINIVSKFGLRDVEIITVEVKVNVKNWKLDIFEAISHKRFSNRVYFCYPVTQETSKIDSDMYRYAELYQIGIIQLVLDKDELIRLITAGNESELPVLNDKSDSIVIAIPAHYDFIPPRHQIEFLSSLGIEEEQDLFRFGRAGPI